MTALISMILQYIARKLSKNSQHIENIHEQISYQMTPATHMDKKYKILTM
jgi:hypothetical protein